MFGKSAIYPNKASIHKYCLYCENCAAESIILGLKNCSMTASAIILDAVHAHNHALARRLFYHNPIDRGIVIGRHYQKCKLELAHRFSSSFSLAMYMHTQRTQPVHTV